jgi:RNA polymerase sigma-70 factor (ECF subfamily)
VFLAERPMLLALAYRLLGRVTEAEDVVQDAWLRWSANDRAEVANPAAFLTTVTTRLALDRLRSAAARREVYVGPWLPEPLPTGADAPGGFGALADPARSVQLAETATVGLLLLLDRLGPAERAVFVLREAFGLPYPQIAEILERTEDSCRQLLARARRRVADARGTRRGAGAPSPAAARPLVDAFLTAARGGDLERLKALLRHDVVVITDGGGTARAGRRPVHGAQKAARLFGKVFERFYAGTEITHTFYNHAPALTIRTPQRTVVYIFDCGPDGRIAGVYAVLNPEKLGHLPSTGRRPGSERRDA